MAKIATEEQVKRATRYTEEQAIEDLRRNMLASFAGSLATVCRDEHPLAGYPVSSVVPFALDDHFRPVIRIATIAEHTRNAKVSPKASIFLRERTDGGDVQTQWRICLVGDLNAVPEAEHDAVADKYYQHYPKSKGYERMHDFLFFRLEIKRYRIIMGFGDIRWVKAELAYVACPFGADERVGMMSHMNEDHADAMRKYLLGKNVPVHESDEVVMCDIHQYGFVLRHQKALHFIEFQHQPASPMEVRKELVAMAKP